MIRMDDGHEVEERISSRRWSGRLSDTAAAAAVVDIARGLIANFQATERKVNTIF